MTLRELIQLLRRATDVSEIDKYRDEIVELIPETKIMLNFNQQNYADQYDLWEHSLQTVVGLPRDIEDDMVYLAALIHDIGKPDCQIYDERDGKVNMHYYFGSAFKSIRDDMPQQCDTKAFVKDLIELLNEINERYKRMYAFRDMFYEFVENAASRDYQAAVVQLSRIHENNKDSGSVIEKVRSWDIASKNVKCNSSRMRIKRYIGLLANKKLRRKYLGF